MKKILILFLLLTLTGCNAIKESDVVEKFGKKLEENTSYKALVKLTATRGDKNINHEVSVLYSDDNYKVTIKNNDNNTKQILLKNTDGVFVLTPALNKSFKFESQWPTNAYHAYLPTAVYREIVNDEGHTVTKEEKNFVVESLVTSRHNKKIYSQKVILDSKNLNILEVILYDKDKNIISTAKYNEFNYGITTQKEDFDVEKSMTTVRLEIGEGSLDVSNEYREPSIIIDGCRLVNTEQLEDKVIYLYGGEKEYMVIEEVAVENNVLGYNRLYNDIVELDYEIALLADVSLTWHHLGMEYTIVSSDLSLDEMITVANSVN